VVAFVLSEKEKNTTKKERNFFGNDERKNQSID